MKIGLSDKDQTQVKHAFSSLWEVCGNTWDRIFDDSDSEHIKELEKIIDGLEEQVQTLKEKNE